MIDLYKTISIPQWKTLCMKTHTNCEGSLKLITNHIGDFNNPIKEHEDPFTVAILFSLYTFSIEEHGKVLYLLSLKPNDSDEIKIEYKNKFRSHQYKIKLALKDLPLEFTRMPAHKRLAFELIEPNVEARLNIFFTDIDEDGNATNVHHNVDAEYLRQVAWNFRNYWGHYTKKIEKEFKNYDHS